MPIDMSTSPSFRRVLAVGLGATFLPAWMGSALVSSERVGVAIVFFVIALLGTSFAYVHAGQTRDGLLSGGGKLALVGLAVLAEFVGSADGLPHHPYVLAMACFGALLWVIVDFVRLFWIIKKVDTRTLDQV